MKLKYDVNDVNDVKAEKKRIESSIERKSFDKRIRSGKSGKRREQGKEIGQGKKKREEKKSPREFPSVRGGEESLAERILQYIT